MRARIVKKNLDEQVINIIVEKIKNKELKPGQKLESQEEFAAKMGVSRSTVREAFSKLASLGIVDIIQGQGTFIRSLQDDSYIHHVSSSITVLGNESIIQVLKMRSRIEAYNMEIAVEKATDIDIQELKNIRDSLSKLIYSPEEYNEVDKEFHLKIAKISKNPVIVRLLGFIQNSYHEELSSSITIPNSLIISMETIDEMIECIEAKDAAGAVDAMSRHIGALIERTGMFLPGEE